MTPTPSTNASSETRESFLKLPESDQTVPKTAPHTKIDELNAVISTQVDVIMKNTDTKASESASGVIDRGTYLEVDGWKVSKENLGEPTLPAGEIEINPTKMRDVFSDGDSKPKAWSKEVDGQILWFYNSSGAQKEIAHRGEYSPSREELLQMINSVSGNCIEKAKALNIPFAGHRNPWTGEFENVGVFATLLSSSLNDAGGAQYVYLHRKWSDPRSHGNDGDRAFPVRSFLERKGA